MTYLLFIFLIFTAGCTSQREFNKINQGRKNFSYLDESGFYHLARDNKLVSNKLVTRAQIFDSKSDTSKILEKSISVSSFGSIKNKKNRLRVLRPEASEYEVWLEGKKYSSQMKINSQKKSMDIYVQDPEGKSGGKTEIPFPRGKYFCFYGQIPECLHQNFFLSRCLSRPEEKMSFYVIWESYPFSNQILTKIGSKLFSPATVKYEGKFNNLLRYEIEVGGQVIVIHFDESFNFIKLAWIAQGLTISLQGQDIVEDE